MTEGITLLTYKRKIKHYIEDLISKNFKNKNKNFKNSKSGQKSPKFGFKKCFYYLNIIFFTFRSKKMVMFFSVLSYGTTLWWSMRGRMGEVGLVRMTKYGRQLHVKASGFTGQLYLGFVPILPVSDNLPKTQEEQHPDYTFLFCLSDNHFLGFETKEYCTAVFSYNFLVNDYGTSFKGTNTV